MAAADPMSPYRVSEDLARHVEPDALRAQAASILTGAGLSPEDAELVAEALVSADLRGVDSHGVSNLVREYVDALASGNYNPRPQFRVIASSPSGGSIDSDGGHGIVVGKYAMDIAIEKAKVTSVGMVSIINSRHIGMAAYTAMQALEHGMIGVCTSATGPRMLPTFGREPRLGTNPIAVAVPALTEAPFVFDAAWTTVAGNKLKLSRRLGSDLPARLVADEGGNPILEPTKVEPYHHTSMLPLGSERETGSHKGYSMAAVTEILSSMLGGSIFMARIGTGRSCHFVAAIDPAGFGDPQTFLEHMDEFLRELKNTPPAEGHERVLYPGLRESELEEERSKRGIPLHPEVLDDLRDMCAEVGVDYTLPV